MSTGYRNPPKDTQFGKGRSGNPRGRPRQNQQQVSVGSLFRKVAGEQVPIEVDGNRTAMSRWDVYVRQIYTMALNKNNTAARLLDQLKAVSRRFATRGSNYLLNYGGRRETLRSRRVDSQNERLWNASDRTERKPKSVTSAS